MTTSIRYPIQNSTYKKWFRIRFEFSCLLFLGDWFVYFPWYHHYYLHYYYFELVHQIQTGSFRCFLKEFKDLLLLRRNSQFKSHCTHFALVFGFFHIVKRFALWIFALSMIWSTIAPNQWRHWFSEEISAFYYKLYFCYD